MRARRLWIESERALRRRKGRIIMSWQTIVSLVIMSASAALGAMLTQYPADKVPHWIPVILAVLSTVGAGLRGVGVVGHQAPPKVEK